ncbi:MAG: GntR family transcriptional regulator [Bacilli bacterium]|nr:GntR family transcriptional regulator [Bacilli bacterium]
MNFTGREAVYLEIAHFYERLISLGLLKEGEALPSVREVALENRINPNTVERAFKQMVADGFVIAIPKKGFFVANLGEVGERMKEVRLAVSKLRDKGYGEDEVLRAVQEVYRDHDND